MEKLEREWAMMAGDKEPEDDKTKRTDNSAVFKAEVALAALNGGKTLAALAQHFDVHANQITDSKKQPRERGRRCVLSGQCGIGGAASWREGVAREGRAVDVHLSLADQTPVEASFATLPAIKSAA